VPKIPKRLPGLHHADPPRLWRIQCALAACFAVALAGLAGLAVLWAVALDCCTIRRCRVLM